MCGILGAVGNIPNQETIQLSLNALAHRGPNDQGLFYDAQSGIALGQRRLSIIDLSAHGHQPFVSQDGRYTLTFNGEIYNYIELKQELKDVYSFQTKTDTEVLLAAYIQWGEICLTKFNGMFAFAIWDSQEKKLFCARDHVGIKPFFYTQNNGMFAFASEIKGLLALGIPCNANEGIIFDYLARGMYDHTTQTFFEGIHSLAAGYWLTWQAGEMVMKKYWDLTDKQPQGAPLSFEEVKEKFKFLLSDAIRLQFRSDVPVGINLSSGVDSNGLLYYGEKKLGYDIHTFSMCLPDSEYNECEILNTTLSSEQKKRWHQCFVNPDDIFLGAEQMNLIQDQPYGGIPTISYTVLPQEAQKNGIVVLLEGQGVDEILGGYPYYTLEHQKDTQGSFLNQSSLDLSQDMSKLIHADILNPQFVETYKTRQLNFSTPFSSHLLNAQYRDLMYAKLPRVLRFNDHATMHYSRELRVPYLDPRIIEFCFWLPPEYKIQGNEQKVLIREVMKEFLPQVIQRKAKKTFGAVQTPWLRNLYKEQVMNILNSESFQKRPYWDHEKLSKKVEAFYRGEGNNSFFLWQCINLELWFREFID